MPLTPNTRLGPYEILVPLGAGGMGEVYRAKDTRLDRDVAIKVLPDSMTRDADRIARFEREAKVLASLNHPNIGAIHGFESYSRAADFSSRGNTGADEPTTSASPRGLKPAARQEVRFLVLEYVEGETLAQRLKVGALPVDEALEVCKQIAEALEAAHEKGIVHRDLKPGNVMVRSDGTVKVLDFGLARAMTDDSTSAAAMPDSPTVTSPARVVSPTIPGVIMGTAGYMSPEQARGRPVDKRSDIFSFGCVLYEMLTGTQPFRGETVTDSLGAILHKEPDWTALPSETPRGARRLLRRCLMKDRNRRLRDIGDARNELEAVEEETVPVISLRTSKVPFARSGMLLVAGVVLGLGVTLALIRPWQVRLDAPTAAAATRLSINLPPEAPLAPAGAMPLGLNHPSLVMSRDGTRLAYIASVASERVLCIRDMNSGEVKQMPGSKGAYAPSFSPDGDWIGFFSDGKLKKVHVRGERPDVLAQAPLGRGACWGSNGWVYFTPTEGTGVMRVSENGGVPEAVTTSGAGAYTHAWSHVLPTGDALLIGFDDRETAVVRLNKSHDAPLVLPIGGFAQYLPSGHIMYTRGAQLLAIPFDMNRLAITGTPITVVDGVRPGQYSVSHDGTLVYAAGLGEQGGSLVWVDRHGNKESLGLPKRGYGSFALSPNGKRLALPVYDGSSRDIWIYDLARPDTPVRLTHGEFNSSPVWTRDGNALVYRTDRKNGGVDIQRKSADPSVRAATVLLRSDMGATPGAFTPEEELLYVSQTAGRGFGEVWRLPFNGPDAKPSGETQGINLFQTPQFMELFPVLSPDARLLAYTSDETGQWQIYVCRYPDLGGRVQISTQGGEEPRFTSTGREIIYRWGSQWFAVEVSNESEFRTGPPRVALEGPYLNVSGYSWDMSPDGERFLVIEGTEQLEALTELSVLTNFFDEIKRKASSAK